MDELIDRYNKDQLGIGAWVNAYYNFETESYEMTYVSENVRIKIYCPNENEYKELYNNSSKTAYKRFVFPNVLLTIALSYGVITEEQYAVEMQRIESEDFPSINYFQHGLCFKCEGFSFPEGDNYFDGIVDLRNKGEKV